jgi:redox-sensing transcriptional repressor
VLAMADVDDAKVGTTVAGVPVHHLDDLPAIIGNRLGVIGVIATPAGAAQEAADRLVHAGVSSILNFAPVVLSVPRHVTIRKVDLAVELQILSFYQQRRAVAANTTLRDGAGG